MCFKENFVRLCNNANKSPTSVCHAVGITAAAYAQWTEKTVPRRATLIKIADYFGVTPESLLAENEQKEKPVADDELSQNNVKFIGRNGTVIYKRVSPEFIKILESIPDTDEDL